MFKIESYITPLLMGYVDKYVKLKPEDFQLSLWGGDAVLYNLDLRLDVLEKAMQLPIVFQNGHIHELRLHVPWTKLGSEPVVVTINTIECILKLRDTAYSDKASTRDGSEASSRKPSRAVQKQKVRRQDTEDLPPGYLQSLMNKITNNISIIVNNLIVKFVEDDIVLSLNMKSAELYSVNKDWVRSFTELSAPDFMLRRAINICDLTVCLDKRDGSGRIENYQDPLVYRCSVLGRMCMKYESINAKYPSDTKLDFYCERLDLSITDTQLPMFIRIVELGLALYYGTLEFKNVPEPKANEPDSQEMLYAESESSVDAQSGSESESQQGWGEWAWSFVPQIIPDEEAEEQEFVAKKKLQPSVFILGMYAYKMSVMFKLTEHTKEKAHYGPKKVSFKPFMYLESEGISLEVLIQGLLFFDVQCGITNLRIFSQGNCICGAKTEENSRNNLLLSGGDPLPSKTVSNYMTQSLFDSHSAENLGIPVERILDWDHHLEVYTEQHGMEKFGFFWMDYLYAATKNDSGRIKGSASSVSSVEESRVFIHENSLSRYVIGPCHLNIASTTVHRIQKLLDCAYKYDYEPYAKKQTEIVDESRPHPTEEQMKSLEEFIPTRTYHLTLLQPTISFLSAEHVHCDIAKKTYRSAPRGAKGTSAAALYPLFGIQLSSQRFDLQTTSPMYARKLIQLVSKIAGAPGSLLHHCHSHTQIKMFGMLVGLTRVDVNGRRSPLLTVLPATSGAMYVRKLLLPVYWKNSHLPRMEKVYELPQVSLCLTKAALLVMTEILSSWQQTTPRPSNIVTTSLSEDVFPSQEGESRKSLPVLEVTVAGFEMKTCRNAIVTASSGTISSVQTLIYTTHGSTASVTPIVYGSVNTEHLYTPDWLKSEQSSSLEDKNDCFTFTYQLPKKSDQIEAPAVVLVNMEGVTACLDPVLLDWLEYNPIQKVVPAKEKKIELDLEIAKAASPLQGNISQVSQVSSGSTRRQSESLTVTQTPTAGTQPGTDEDREKKRKSDGWGEMFAKMFPVVRLVQVQIEVNTVCLFVPRVALKLTEPSLNIPQNLHKLARSRSLPDLLVICLPHVTVQSAGHKAVSCLQEIPITSMEGSLVGDKIPWNVGLKNFSVYSVHHQSDSPWKALQLLKPTTVMSTVGVSYKYQPPTSDDISALGLCLHTDMHNVTGSISPQQVMLLMDLSKFCSKLALKLTDLLTEEGKKLRNTDKPVPPITIRPPSPDLQLGQQTLTSVTSFTGDGLMTETSYDLGSMDTTPSREFEILEAVGGGVKLSLWLQWTLPKCELRLYCPGLEDQKLSLVLEDITLSVDVQDVYSKFKMNLGAANIDHFIRESATHGWQRGPKHGIIMTCRGNLSHDTNILSSRLWSADHSGASNKGNLKINTNQRDVTHGFVNLTFTRALRKNVKKKFLKMNIDIPALQDSQTDMTNQFPFHKYVSEICVSVNPCDFVVSLSPLQGVIQSFNNFESAKPGKTQGVSQSASKSTLDKKSRGPKPLFTSSNLPLIYADFSCIRVFIPRETSHVGGRCKTTIDHDLLMMQIQSISISPQVDNPLPRYAVRKELWQRAVQMGVTSQPGSALLDRQYQIDLSGMSLSTGCWEGFLTKTPVSQKTQGTPGTQIPALEWNALQTFERKHEEIELFPLISACEVRLVVAPAVVHTLPGGDLENLVCGHSVEFNITSDLDFHVSTNQIHLLQKLVSESLRCLSPPSDSSYELLDDKDSVKDSGIGSDISINTAEKVKPSQESTEDKASSSRSKTLTPFSILLTAGRISCMVYSHKVTQEEITVTESHKNQGVEKKSPHPRFEWKVDSEHDLGAEDGYEHIQVHVEEFEELSFMNIHDTSLYENEPKVIPGGSMFIQPFLYFYVSQPHLIVSCQQDTQKFEMSCYDILVKGPGETSIVQVTDTKLMPDCSDYTSYWVETRAGQPNLVTGIPPCLYTLRVTDFLKDTAGFSLKLERPVKLSLSFMKLQQAQQLLEAVYPQKATTRSRSMSKGESSRSSEPSGLQVILNKMHYFEFETDQIVVAMETKPCDQSPGVNASFTSLRVEADLQQNNKGELDNISSTAYVRDLYIQTKYERRLSALLGPCSVKIDGTFSHCCYDRNQFLSQSVVTIATGLVLINVGQEHVLCLNLLSKHLQEMLKELFGTKESKPGDTKCVEKQEELSQSVGDVVLHRSTDDLRSGGFQYRMEGKRSEVMPSPGEIIFCNKEKDGNSTMTWSYSHPRVISNILCTPIPFNVSGEDSEAETKVYCSLQYWEGLVQQFVDYAEVVICESNVTTTDLPDIRTANTRDLTVSTIWRIVIKMNNGEQVVLPTSLAASMKIDSCFIPSLIPQIQVGCTLESVELHLHNHLHCLTSGTPSVLEPFYITNSGPKSEQFAILTVENILFAGSQLGGQHKKTNLQFSALAMVDVLEYKVLSLQKLVSPFEFSGIATIQPKPKPSVIDCDITCDIVDVKVGRGVLHTLTTSLQAWNQTLSQMISKDQAGNQRGNQTRDNNGCQPLFGHYILCNDTQQPIRFGQAGTDENLVLQPREMQEYSWRSHKMKQVLHVCVDSSTWKWCEPFGIDDSGLLVKTVASSELNYTLIIKVKRLSNVQNQIIICGQLHINNRLDIPVEISVSSGQGLGGRSHRVMAQARHIVPSFIMELSQIESVKFRCPGRNLAWSKEVYIYGEKAQESGLVKLQLADKKSFHVWCQVFTQNAKAAKQIVVVLCPLYIVRSHLPCPLYINIDTSKLNIHRQIETRGQGTDLQLQCTGGDIHHSLTFQFSPSSGKSSTGVTLSTGLIDQLTRSEVKDTDFDSFYRSGRSDCQFEWPYCREQNLRDEDSNRELSSSPPTIMEFREVQSTIDLSISLSELWAGCSTVLVDVTPWCLFTNICQLDLVLMGAEDRSFQVLKGSTISPPKIEGSFHIGVKRDNKVYMSAPIPLSEEEVGAQRYRNDIGKTLYLDSFVHMAVFTEHQSEVYYLTVSSSVNHKMRTITVRERYCLSNYTTFQLSMCFFSVPQWSEKVKVPEQPGQSLIKHTKCQPDDSDLHPFTFHPVVCTHGKKHHDIDHNTDFIHYLSLQHTPIVMATDAEKTELPCDWSYPVRLSANENSSRMTGSIQVDKGGYCESTPLCITGHVKKGISYFVIREDSAPACLLKNKCPFGLMYGQTLMNLSLSGATVQEETELVDILPGIDSNGGEIYYTPPLVNTTFPEIKDKPLLPKLHLAGDVSLTEGSSDKPSLQWSHPIDLLVAADTFVKIPAVADVRVHVQHIAMVTHVTIEPVTKAEVSAKEIRSRLKGKERTIVVESKHIEEDIVKGLKEELIDNIHKEEEKKQDQMAEILEEKFKHSACQYNIGLFVKQFAFIIQDELSSHEIQGELLRLTVDDLFAAYYPASAMLEDTRISRNCVVVSVGDIQLDNQIHDQGKYDFPVVLVRQNFEKPRTVHDYDQLIQMNIIEKHAILKSTSVIHLQVVLSNFSNRNTVIESVQLTARPMSVFVDDTFIFRVIKEVEGFIPTRLSDAVTLPVLVLKLPQFVKSSSRTGSCPIRIGHLSVHQLSVLMSVHASIKLFIASDHTPLTFSAFERNNLYTTGHQLIRVMVMHYASGALFKAGAVVGSLEILGNPTGLVRSIGTGVADFFRMPYRGLTRGPGAFVLGVSSGTSSMVKNITTGMLTSVTNFASSVSRNMDRLSMDRSHLERQEETRRHRPDGVSDGLIQGLTGLGLSVLGAIAGLADQPIQNIVAQQTQTDKVPTTTAAAGSIMTGVGKGLVGAFTKPIGGAAEFVSQTGQGILHGTGLSRPPKPRSSNPYPQLSEASCGQTKYAQKVLQSIPSCDIVFCGEAGYVEVTDTVSPVTLILTPEILFVINHEDDEQQQAFAVAELECGVKTGDTTLLTIIWRDTFSSHDDRPSLSKEDRVAAFIDSTVPVTGMRRDQPSPAEHNKEHFTEKLNTSRKLHLETDLEPLNTAKEGTLLQLTLSADGRQLNTVIADTQLSDSDSTFSVIEESVSVAALPQYDFHMRASKMATFLAIFNITKRKLQGSGFAL